MLLNNINEIIKNSSTKLEYGYKSHFMVLNNRINRFDNSIRVLSFVTNDKNEIVIPPRIVIGNKDANLIGETFVNNIEAFIALDKTSSIDDAIEYLLELYFSINNDSYSIGNLN